MAVAFLRCVVGASDGWRHRALTVPATAPPASFDADAYTIEVVWTTGARVRRCDPWDGDEFDEELSLEDGAVRLDRLNAGAAFLDSHDPTECSRVVGTVVRGSRAARVSTPCSSPAPGTSPMPSHPTAVAVT